MRTFEVGKIYSYGAVNYAIVNRTAQFVTFIEIMHLGRYNERRSEPTRTKIKKWEGREVFFDNYRTVEA